MKYLQFTRAEFLRGLRYRANYWAALTGSLMLAAIQWSLWHGVYKNVDHVGGIDLPTMIGYSLMGRVTAGFLGEPANLKLAPRVRTGAVVHDLVKPTNLHTQLLFQCLGGAAFRLVFSGLPLFCGLYVTGAIQVPNLSTSIAFFASLLAGYVTVFSLSFLSGVLTFYSQSGVGLEHIYSVVELLSGFYLPLQLFPSWLRKLASFLPFQAVHHTPMAIFSGLVKPAEIPGALVTQAIWTCAAALFSRIVWGRAIRRLAIGGG